jgi:hypothetical protein
MLHEIKITNGGSFNFGSNPPKIIANVDSNVSIFAMGQGRVIGNTGTRIWDASRVSGSESPSTTINITILAGNNFPLPVRSDLLPSTLFDAILIVDVNGIKLPIAVSNSPDNAGIYLVSEPQADKKLFWADLFCFGTWDYGFGAFINPGDPSQNFEYMFGGSPRAGYGANIPLNVYFGELLTSPLSVTYTLKVYDNSNTLIGIPVNITQVLAAGSSVYTLGSVNIANELANIYGGFYNSRVYSGHFKIEISTPDLSYRSILPFYHWGVH